MMTFEYCELVIVGTGAGVAFWHLFTLEEAEQNLALKESVLGAHHFGLFFEKGEEFPCACVIVSCTLVYLSKLFEILKRDVLRTAEQNLDFTTVREAERTNPDDEQRIRQAIAGDEDAIDEAITMLQTVGRYDIDVKANLDNGLSYEHARDGIVPSKVMTACCCFAFWWVTDLMGRGYIITACILQAGVCALGLAVAYFVGERCVFAMIAAMWTGIFFVVASNHYWFFKEEVVTSLSMSTASAPLLLIFLLVNLICDLAFYKGWCMRVNLVLAQCLPKAHQSGRLREYGQISTSSGDNRSLARSPREGLLS